jgi:hypothetical protein
MSQDNSMAVKARFLIDGTTELSGLTNLGEVNLENGVIDVPEFNYIRKIQSGITTMPEIQCSFETRRDSTGGGTRATLEAWFNNKEVKDVTIVYMDATGTEFERDSWTSVELRKLSKPAVDASSPTYAKLDVTFLPYEIELGVDGGGTGGATGGATE